MKVVNSKRGSTMKGGATGQYFEGVPPRSFRPCQAQGVKRRVILPPGTLGDATPTAGLSQAGRQVRDSLGSAPSSLDM